MIKYLLAYIIIINIIGYWSMWEDKKRAIRKEYRISEKNLFMIAIVGGSLGSIAGMQKFRHKTKHWYFTWGMPFILVVQVLLVKWIVEVVKF